MIKTYRAVAADFDAGRDRRLVERRWLDRWLAAAPRTTGRIRALDLGCGGGRPIATYVAERGAEVTGVDTAPELLDLFAERLPRAEAIEGDMRRLDLGRQFDAILAWDSFFHLSAADQRGMFATFAAHAAPGAALMFTSGTEAGTAIGEVGGRPIFHESLSTEEYRERLDDAGFDVLAHVAEDPDCAGHTVWLARARLSLTA
ncbi:methyltransferase [Wenxinia marina]|nr:methyltransferase [Wenxinia marina]